MRRKMAMDPASREVPIEWNNSMSDSKFDEMREVSPRSLMPSMHNQDLRKCFGSCSTFWSSTHPCGTRRNITNGPWQGCGSSKTLDNLPTLKPRGLTAHGNCVSFSSYASFSRLRLGRKYPDGVVRLGYEIMTKVHFSPLGCKAKVEVQYEA